MFSHPYISFFHLLVNGLFVTSFRTFFADPYLLLIDGRYIGRGKIKFLVITVIKAQISGKLVTSGISHAATASVNSEKPV